MRRRRLVTARSSGSATAGPNSFSMVVRGVFRNIPVYRVSDLDRNDGKVVKGIRRRISLSVLHAALLTSLIRLSIANIGFRTSDMEDLSPFGFLFSPYRGFFTGIPLGVYWLGRREYFSIGVGFMASQHIAFLFIGHGLWAWDVIA